MNSDTYKEDTKLVDNIDDTIKNVVKEEYKTKMTDFQIHQALEDLRATHPLKERVKCRHICC